jgi:hypothetical protein
MGRSKVADIYPTVWVMRRCERCRSPGSTDSTPGELHTRDWAEDTSRQTYWAVRGSRLMSTSNGASASQSGVDGYHLLPGVRGDMLARLRRLREARAEFIRAAALTGNARERELLQARARDAP